MQRLLIATKYGFIVMRLSVENFGPINRANLDIRPITVIVGRNNIGKSFLSQLIYAAFSSIKKPAGGTFGGKLPNHDLYSILNLFADTDDGLPKLIAQLSTDNTPPKEFSDKYYEKLQEHYSAVFRVLFSDAIESTFNIDLGKLVSINSDAARISIQVTPYLSFVINIKSNGAMSVNAKISYQVRKIIQNIATRSLRSDSSDKQIEAIRDNINKEVRLFVFKNYSANYSYYLPAGRGGLIDSWDIISTALFNLSSIALSQGLTLPALPGTAAKFYTTLYFASREKSNMFSSECDAFKHILSGDIRLMQQSSNLKKDILYHFNYSGMSSTLNILHAASLVKEIAPLYLIVRDVLKVEDSLIIEEPESHLHPAAQKQLIKVLLSLCEKNARILLTTHSDIFLRYLTIETTKIISANSSPDIINPNNFRIYLLSQGRHGSKLSRIPISEHGTISELPTFDRVIEELYDEETRLETKIND